MKAYYLQCTMWKDKKQVMFIVTNQLDSARVWQSSGMSRGRRSVKPFRNPMPMQITSSQWMVLIGMIEIAAITWQVSAPTGGTSAFFAGQWIGLCMLNTVSWYFLQSRVLESQSGRNTGTKIRVDMISKLISEYLFSTTASVLTGMDNHVTDLATCEKVPSSLVNARCVSFVWRESPTELCIHQRRKQQLLWNTNAGHVWWQISVPTCKWV